MNRNIKEDLGTSLLLAAAIGIASMHPGSLLANSPGIEQPSAANQLTPFTGLEIQPAPPKESIPFEVRLLMRNDYLKAWRNALPEDTEVTIIDFGKTRHSGPVLPEDGLKLRERPTTNSKPARLVQWLRAGQEVNFRNLISIFNPKTGEEESWIVVDEKGQPGARWHCGPGWPRGHSLCFAAAIIGKKVFIDLAATAPPRAESVTSHNWPADLHSATR